ncbi:MAG: hypothetical protein Kilf2KO_02710 [Rhodospirillales bacterium]
MSWVLTGALCVLLVELCLRLPFGPVLSRLVRSSSRALHVVRAKAVSDHWKEKAMAAYARTTFASTFKLALLLGLLLAVATGLVLALERIAPGFEAFILSWLGIGVSVVFACLYVGLRKSLLRDRL